jgi:phosphonoacetate hydrolase
VRSIVSLEINGRRYPAPETPVVVVCVDGSEPEYHHAAISAGDMPFLDSLGRPATSLTAECVMPSFTNPNNVSIATGAAPSVHGICGNFFLDPETGSEVMMNEPALLRAPTILAEFSKAGLPVAVVTAKDKLRRLLGAGLDSGVCLSAEKPDLAVADGRLIPGVPAMVGLPPPDVYSAELSEFALAAGTHILQTRRPMLMYISLSDYVQHKHPPGAPEANSFYRMLDSHLYRLHRAGAVLLVTADHGMNAKVSPSGLPQVRYLQDVMDRSLGPGTTTVILPITDPYVAHHAALGSFAAVHVPGADVHDAVRVLAALPGIASVLTRDEACRTFQLPPDRTADVVVVAERDVVLGTTPGAHDLSRLDRPLRSHGGLSETRVPFILNRPVQHLPAGRALRNFDAFWVGIHHATG